MTAPVFDVVIVGGGIAGSSLGGVLARGGLEAGVGPLRAREGARRVVEHCLAAGGESMGRRVVAEWSGAISPADVVADWTSLSRMGSIAVDLVKRQEILAKLQDWARGELGDLDQPEAYRERYAIDCVRLPR